MNTSTVSDLIISSIQKSLVLVSLVGLVTCGEDQPTGNSVTVKLSFDAYTSEGAALTADSTVTDVSFCFKRLRFKAADVEGDESSDDESSDNIDFDLGQLTLDEEGTVLGDVSVPEGKYKRLEFDFDKKCDGGYSVKLTNSHGTFQTDDRVKIKFRGDFEASESNPEVGLAIETILAELEGITSDDGIKDAIGDPSGILKKEGAPADKGASAGKGSNAGTDSNDKDADKDADQAGAAE